MFGASPGLHAALAACALTIVAGVFLLGLPGAVVYAASKPLIRLVYGSVMSDSELGDRAWPLAIFVSLLWPFGIVVGYGIAFRLGGALPKPGQVVVLVAVICCWAAGVSVLLYGVARRT